MYGVLSITPMGKKYIEKKDGCKDRSILYGRFNGYKFFAIWKCR